MASGRRDQATSSVAGADPPALTTAAHKRTQRLPALDGLRGVAALVVVVHHCLSAIPSLAEPLQNSGAPTSSAIGPWLLRHTPLHLLWAGGEAVYVFFILSGLVLTLPALQSSEFSWTRYYPRRIVRLYLPVFGAVAFAVVTLLVVPRSGLANSGFWLSGLPTDFTARSLAKDALLLSGASSIVGPLWSLRWELVFSLLLPAYVIIVMWSARWPLLVAGGALALSAVGSVLSMGPLLYLPMFAVGAVVASALDPLRAWWQQRSWWVRFLLVTAVPLVLVAPWMMGAWMDWSSLVWFYPLSIVGAAGVVVLAVCSPVVSRCLVIPPVRDLGRISFSLYLVHEPIVVALAVLLGPGRDVLVLPIGLPLSLVAAWMFFRAVEAPSHRLAQSMPSWSLPQRA